VDRRVLDHVTRERAFPPSHFPVPSPTPTLLWLRFAFSLPVLHYCYTYQLWLQVALARPFIRGQPTRAPGFLRRARATVRRRRRRLGPARTCWLLVKWANHPPRRRTDAPLLSSGVNPEAGGRAHGLISRLDFRFEGPTWDGDWGSRDGLGRWGLGRHIRPGIAGIPWMETATGSCAPDSARPPLLPHSWLPSLLFMASSKLQIDKRRNDLDRAFFTIATDNGNSLQDTKFVTARTTFPVITNTNWSRENR